MADAEAARKFQKRLINIDQGKYELINNSCYSHVFDVLETGGYDPIRRSKIGFFKFMKKHNFERIEDTPDIES